MKNIKELYNCDYDFWINDIKTNSKEVNAGDLFVCIRGVKTDRHNFIQEAINRGCSGLIVERGSHYAVPSIKVKDANAELGVLAKKFYDYGDTLKLIGVTGTDGKTTTSSVIRDLLQECGYIGTNGIKGRDFELEQHNTTPPLNQIYKYLAMFEREDLKYASMEVSSEGLLHNRVSGLKFDVGILTNISEDHLNVHKTLSNYIDSKLKLFKNIKKDGYAILNRDDRFYDKFLENCDCHIFTYGRNVQSDLIIKDYVLKDDGTMLTINYQNRDYDINTTLRGEYNVYNLTAAIASLICLGFSLDDITKRVSMIGQVAGRCEFFNFPNFQVVLDYAHTQNGLKSILTYLNAIKKKRIITVVGSAGGREREKRRGMGQIVQELSDLVIYTMDDPRFEKVSDIIDDMKDLTKENYLIIENRERAIKKALELAQTDDIVLIAGKGRDQYMAVGDEYLKYSDYEVITKLQERSNI